MHRQHGNTSFADMIDDSIMLIYPFPYFILAVFRHDSPGLRPTRDVPYDVVDADRENFRVPRRISGDVLARFVEVANRAGRPDYARSHFACRREAR